jgi:putative transposase
VGSRGDSNHNAATESFNGLYKSELIYKDEPWTGLEDVEHATLDYVDWFNNTWLHRSIGDVPPAEFEESYYHQQAVPGQLAATQ